MLKLSFSLCLLALTATITPVIADQGILADVSSAADSALSSLSSLFNPTPSRLSPATPSICCGDSCCPACCDNYHVIPTDLGYAYPAPTPAPFTQSFDTKRPCCTLGCVDGACRIPTATLSQRPVITNEHRHRKGGPQGDDLNIIVGCCDTCTACGQSSTFVSDVQAEATATASLAGHEKIPLAIGASAICIGCGKCHPCDNARGTGFLEFLPSPSEQPDIPGATATTTPTTTEQSRAKAVTTSNAAEPTYYLGDDINDAINGQNQAFIPLVVQNGAKTKQLLTLLATVDLKLTENYISRRMLKQLQLLKQVTPFPKGVESRIAYLSYHQDKSIIDASIVLDFVAGNPDEGTQKHFANVRFMVYGKEDDEVIRVPDVIVGEKFLREVSALTVFPRFKTTVRSGVKLVYPAHEGVLQDQPGAAVDEAETKHDEL